MNQPENNKFDSLIEAGIFYKDSEQLGQEKIEARKRLLAMAPEEAQKLVDQTLYPQYWEFHIQDHVWEETL